MKLTPLDIRHQEFRRALRGYSEEEVDVFLDEVADEFDGLVQGNIELQERIQLLEEQLAEYAKLKETLNNTLVSAQQQADTTRANANMEGELVLRDAELRARGIVGDAYTEKERVEHSLIQLRQVEEDFRSKFRSLLEAHIDLLGEDEVSEERRRFRGLAGDVEQQLEPSLADDESARSSAEQTSDVPAGAEPEWEPALPEPALPEPAEASDQADPEAVPDGTLDEAPADEESVGRAAGDQGSVEETPADRPPADPAAGDDATVGPAPGDEPTDDEAKGSPVRRFLFGKRDKPESEELFEKKDRDFEW
jgi:cell division initiation protein